MTRIFSHEDDRGKLKPGRAARCFFECAADPHFNHRAPPREVEIGVVQRTGVQPRGMGGCMDRIGGEFPADKSVGGRQRKEVGPGNPADDDACCFDCFSIFRRTKPDRYIEDRKID
jgi:hypothetical protein